MDEKRFGVLSSSADPKQLSTTVRGAILGLSALIIPLGAYLGFSFSETDVAQFANQFGLAIGSLIFIYGVIQKGIIAIHSRFSKN